MTRLVILAAVAGAILALFVRSRRARLILWGLLVALAVYAVLKGTGVIEALAPDRDGVF